MAKQPEKVPTKTPTPPEVPNTTSQKNGSKRIGMMPLDFGPSWSKGLLYVFIGLLFLPMLFSLFSRGETQRISLSEMIQDVRDQEIKKIEVSGNDLNISYNDNTKKTARKEEGQELVAVFSAADIDLNTTNIDVATVSGWNMLWDLLLTLLPIILMVGVLFFIFRQARGAQDGIMGIGRSKAKLFVKGKQNINFKDVGGMDEAKRELEEIVDFLRDPRKYKKVGARTPKGVLLVGPAGTGKTLLARAVAGEANVQFLSIAGSEFMEMLVGVGASRARDLFATAKKLAPAIIFIDEIDAIGYKR
jgi:cell division protease FtsH